MGSLSEFDVIALLRVRHQPPSWAFLSHVPDSTGGARRTADAVAMGLWRSRGMEVHGYEVKTDRRDWLRELKNPEKADLIAGYCNHFDVVAPPGVVKDGELPPTWGLLEVREHSPKAKGSHFLKRIVTGRAIDPKPLDRLFVAAVLRVAVSQLTSEKEIAEVRTVGYDDGFRNGQLAVNGDTERWKAEAEDLQKMIDAYERASGVYLQYRDPKRVGDAVRIVEDGGETQRLALDNARRALSGVLVDLERAIAEFPTPEQLRKSVDNTTGR